MKPLKVEMQYLLSYPNMTTYHFLNMETIFFTFWHEGNHIKPAEISIFSISGQLIHIALPFVNVLEQIFCDWATFMQHVKQEVFRLDLLFSNVHIR